MHVCAWRCATGAEFSPQHLLPVWTLLLQTHRKANAQFALPARQLLAQVQAELCVLVPKLRRGQVFATVGA